MLGRLDLWIHLLFTRKLLETDAQGSLERLQVCFTDWVAATVRFDFLPLSNGSFVDLHFPSERLLAKLWFVVFARLAQSVGLDLVIGHFFLQCG